MMRTCNHLWSLWDMMRVYAHKYMQLGGKIREAQNLLHFTEHEIERGLESGEVTGLISKEYGDLPNVLGQLKAICNDLQLYVSSHLLGSTTPTTSGELDIMANAVVAELKTTLFLYVPNNRAAYFEKEPGWQSEFPEAAADFRSAYRCFAAGEPTAAVFHTMRALERGLHAMVGDLQMTLPKPIETLQWANIIDQINAEIKRKRGEKGGAENPKIEFWSSAAANFFIFKEAWRNKVTHARVTYSESEGEKIINAVDDVMDRLAAQLTEPSGTTMGPPDVSDLDPSQEESS